MTPQDFIDVTCKELGLAPHKIQINPDQELNAFLVPGFNIIVLTSALLEKLSENEVYAVLVHELGHAYYGHYKARVAMMAGRTVMTGINLFLPLPIWKKFLIEIGCSIAAVAVQIPMYYAQEYEADSLAFRYHLNGDLATALLKLEKTNSTSTPAFMSVFGRLTHPATSDRVAKLNATVINA